MKKIDVVFQGMFLSIFPGMCATAMTGMSIFLSLLLKYGAPSAGRAWVMIFTILCYAFAVFLWLSTFAEFYEAVKFDLCWDNKICNFISRFAYMPPDQHWAG